ncbi:hypothetical protein K435DRAFT_797355 [Dendrothele bispora CBS 962.96]|uniref:Uncharacterized protein n=1 Tax=Dendrothele bispora (strain CBS 962.96) TaxID=1314807 RepID=A0A4S8M327_DENBC|nr:hypothetical protein K435DRAFT_797355 [Dendrothele bispora CBS 962.96]
MSDSLGNVDTSFDPVESLDSPDTVSRVPGIGSGRHMPGPFKAKIPKNATGNLKIYSYISDRMVEGKFLNSPLLSLAKAITGQNENGQETKDRVPSSVQHQENSPKIMPRNDQKLFRIVDHYGH